MKLSQMVFNSQSGHTYMVEMALFNVQRAIIPKVENQVLWFMCSAHHSMMLYIYVKFHENFSNGFLLTEWTLVHGRNGYIPCSKGNNSRTRNPTLWFICSACCLIVLYICVKFSENISNDIRVTEQTQMSKALMG